MPVTAPVLEVAGLSLGFRQDGRMLGVLDGISFRAEAGKTLAIVGESGCGKSVASLAIMGLLPDNAQVSGSARLMGRDLLGMSAEERRVLRGAEMAMIFQEPMTSLNPAFTAGEQVAEALRLHQRLDRDAAFKAAIAMLEKAKLLIADEPTTALDVTVQAQILALLDDLKRETGTAVILITHDLGVVADHADDVVVMYAGRVAEQAQAAALFARPEHPYTIGLLGAAPAAGMRGERLASIEGTVPDLRAPPPGCRFAPRCPFAIARCAEAAPALAQITPGHFSACIRAPLDNILGAAA